MNFGALSRGFGTCCLRFKNRVATIPAKLASGWLARLYREGVEPSGSLQKVSDHISRPPFLDLSWRKGSFIFEPPSRFASLDQLVREYQDKGRDIQTEGFGSREIDDELEFGRLLHRQFGRLRPAQNPINILGGAPELVRKAWPIGHETSPYNVITRALHRRQSSP